MRWWAVFDHGQKKWKSNFVLDPILHFGQKSELFLSHFELWKKGWSFKPATEKLNLKYLKSNNIFTFLFLLYRASKKQRKNGGKRTSPCRKTIWKNFWPNFFKTILHWWIFGVLWRSCRLSRKYFIEVATDMTWSLMSDIHVR